MTGQGLAIAGARILGCTLPCSFSALPLTQCAFPLLHSCTFLLRAGQKCLRVPLGLDYKNEMCKHRSLHFYFSSGVRFVI